MHVSVNSGTDFLSTRNSQITKT